MKRPATGLIMEKGKAMAEDTQTRRKRLQYQCWYRGCKETDILLGKFVDAHIHELDDAQLDELEALMREDDADIYKWLSGGAPVPDDKRSSVLDMLLQFDFSK